MKLHYYPETDSLYVELSETLSLESKEVFPGVVIDCNAEGKLVGIDLDHASTFVNFGNQLTDESYPI
jgi:uncharacterized protein YuzE